MGFSETAGAILDDIEPVHEDELFSQHVTVDDSTRAAVRQILSMLLDPKLKLPILPASAQEALQLSTDPDATFPVMQRVIEADPMIAARVMSVANSSLYSNGQPLTSLRQALFRLGMDSLKGILMAAVMDAHAMGAGVSEKIETLRRHSMIVAHVAMRMCKEIELDGEQAFVCGLFHDIGQPILIQVLADHGRDLCISFSEQDIVDILHGVAGERLLLSWKLPPIVARVARYHHGYGYPDDPQGYCAMANVVAAADSIAYVAGVGEWPMENEIVAEDALEDLGLPADRLAHWVQVAKDLADRLGK